MGRLASMIFVWLVVLAVLQQSADASSLASGKAPVKTRAAKPVQDAPSKQQHSHAMQDVGSGGGELQAKAPMDHPCMMQTAYIRSAWPFLSSVRLFKKVVKVNGHGEACAAGRNVPYSTLSRFKQASFAIRCPFLII